MTGAQHSLLGAERRAMDLPIKGTWMRHQNDAMPGAHETREGGGARRGTAFAQCMEAAEACKPNALLLSTLLRCSAQVISST